MIKRIIWILVDNFIREHCVTIVNVFYGSIWKLRTYIIRGGKHQNINKLIYKYYCEYFGSFIGLGAKFEDIPCFPHGIMGIFISNSAHIGKDCTIFHQVTIGSNMTVGSKGYGAPTIGDNVYIGCGAKVIGNINVGNNSRIGANAIVVKDVPANSVNVMRSFESIIKTEQLDNTFVANNTPDFKDSI